MQGHTCMTDCKPMQKLPSIAIIIVFIFVFYIHPIFYHYIATPIDTLLLLKWSEVTCMWRTLNNLQDIHHAISSIHSSQNNCPQLVCTGSETSSRQMEHLSPPVSLHIVGRHMHAYVQ